MLRNLFLWLQTVLLFILLTFVYRNNRRSRLTEQITNNVRKRQKRRNIRISRIGVPEDLDEVASLPTNCSDNISFVNFSKDGTMCFWRRFRHNYGQEVSMLYLDVPGTGRFLYKDPSPHPAGRGPLKVLLDEPMRRWRVQFQGTLLSLVNNEPLHATVTMFWECLTDPFDHWNSLSTWQLAQTIARSDGLRLLSSSENGIWYDQWGEMWGRISIEGKETIRKRMKSCKTRIFSDQESDTVTGILAQHVCVEPHGQLFTSAYDRRVSCALKTGHVTFPCGERLPVAVNSEPLLSSSSDVGLNAIPSVVKLAINGKRYTVERSFEKASSVVGGEHPGSVSLRFCIYKLDGRNAYGVEIHLPTSVAGDVFKNMKIETKQFENYVHQTVIGLDDVQCLDSKVVGAKACNLAKLTKHGFKVTKGICITSEAFLAHIANNNTLKNAVNALSTALKESNVSLQSMCTDAVSCCRSSTTSGGLSNEIQNQLHQMFGPKCNQLCFAVRSSSSSEDEADTSSAGQLKTTLNVKGLDSVCKEIVNCWASSFSYQVIEYRRQNGLCLVEPMGVIVQEMVDAAVAGVLFTNDPVTGNTREMVINATCGLGEAVVSGMVNTDFVKIKRGGIDHNFIIVDYIPSGSNTGTVSGKCLTDKDIQCICQTGIEVEDLMGGAQDIEWAIKDGCLYLLQARPITSLDVNDTEDIIHEFDTPISSEVDCLTTGNLGEVLPGTITPLTLSTSVRALGGGLQYVVEGSSYSLMPYFANKLIPTSANKLFLNLTPMCTTDGRVPFLSKNDIEMFLVGNAVPENTKEAIMLSEGRQKSLFTTIKCFINHFFIRIRQKSKLFQQWAEKVHTFSIGDNSVDAESLYGCIDDSLDTLSFVWETNLYKTSDSAAFSAVLMTIFRGNKLNMDIEDNIDLSLLLSCCNNVESADVPMSLHALATVIADSPTCEQFVNLTDTEAVAYLRSCEDESVQNMFADFLRKHGHRCFRESELMEKSWDMDPEPLIGILKRMVEGNDRFEFRGFSIDEALNNLHKPLSLFQRFLFKTVLVPNARKGVAARERGKSATIKTGDVIKKAYWRLARLMVSEGRLPEPELLFFLTHREIGTLLDTRSAALLRKAKRRKAVFAVQDTMTFPTINVGRPVHLQANSESQIQFGTAVYGTTVCSGVVTGRACVVSSLQEADKVEKGDILICPYTDVAWTPYFYMISGLVTEIGSFLSHGSVVAREVGIPCLARVSDVTKKFETGDIVKLDGSQGSLQKVQK